MGALMRSHDWKSTPLGDPPKWPQSLRTVASIVLNSRYAMWFAWGDELTFFYNDAYRPTLGLKHPWALGRPATAVWAEIWDVIGPRIRSVLSEGVATYDEGLLLFLERSGFPEETYHTFSYSPISDDSGRISGVLCVVTEETDRVISERRMETLRVLAAHLGSTNTEAEVLSVLTQDLAANSRDLPFTLIYLYEPGGDARLACSTNMPSGHPAAPARIGREEDWPWPTAEMFHRPTSRFVEFGSAGLGPMPKGAWEKPPEQAAIVPIRQQGHERPAGFFVVGINPYRRFDADYRGFVDLISGQVAAALSNAGAYEEERRRADALAELDRAKNAFFSNVSHEFRTPLTLMLGPVEDLLAQANATDRDLLEVVRRSGLRLQRLVNTLLDFSRIEAGRAQSSYQPTDLAAFTVELASTFQSAMQRAGLEFTIDCRPLSNPVFVDHEMWEKIVLNLLSNAFKYTLAGSVGIRLVECDGGAKLSIQDTGSGIPAAELPRLFERFHRIEPTVGRTHEGTGIGLALVQELVNLHRGSVSVESEFGAGSTFTVFLPFGTEHLPQDRIRGVGIAAPIASHSESYVEEALRWVPKPADSMDAGPVENLSPLPRNRVLVADDNTDMRDYLRRLLSPQYEVLAASNGEEALAMARAQLPDLVLSDVMMPRLDGFGLLRALREDPSNRTVPVILLSARAGEEAKIEGVAAGADDYLVKPFVARELLARVGTHVALRRERLRSQERLAQIFSQAPVGIVVVRGRDMVVELANPVYQALLGKTDLVGRPLAEIVPELGQHVWDALHSVLDTGQPFVANDFHASFDQDGDGVAEDHWFNVVYHPLQESDGAAAGIIAVLTEVTGQVRARMELERANRELEEFAYASSHDLQEPLRMVNIYSQLLLENVPAEGEDARVFAGFVRDGVTRMEALIKDLLTYSRIVHPEQDEVQDADLNQSLSEALSVLKVRMEESGAEVVGVSLPLVVGEARQLALVFQNLLSNAIKYTRIGEKPYIEIDATEHGDRWLISVKDRGIGFDPKHAERIFGLFKRLHKGTYPGTGLGLAICKRIVERYGGQIWGTSSGEGEGATFSFSLKRSARELPVSPVRDGQVSVVSDAVIG